MARKSVLELINEVAFDPEHKDEVSVLPLMCGTGKSTAISYKIQETIKSANTTGNGLLIITDRKDRMDDYMNPKRKTEKELRDFLQAHQNQVTIMTHDNLDDAFKTFKFRPILMMTTQRFFRLTQEEIKQFLLWEKDGKQLARPLIIIDERPELTTIVELNEEKINNCLIAIEHVFKQKAPCIPIAEIDSAQNAFRKFTNNLDNEEVGGKEDIYCFWSWFTNEEDAISMDERFSQIMKKRDVINNYAGGTYYEDNYTRVRGIYHLTEAKALFYHRWLPTQVCLNSFFTFLDNSSLLKGIPAKTIILDGTAQFSPEYKLITNEIHNYPEYDRNLRHLKIHVINLPTSKSRMLNLNYRKYVMKCVQMYYDEEIRPEIGQDYSRFALFTYKKTENNYHRWLPKDRVEHFGNIIGKNNFGNAKHIIQVGLNRFPDSIYYLYYLALHPEELNRYENMQDKGYDTAIYSSLENSETANDVEVTFINSETVMQQSSEIKQQITDHVGHVRDIMNKLLLAEIEQNLFRGIIRNDDCAEDYHFHLFTNTYGNRELIKMMKARFEPLGADVQAEMTSVSIFVQKIMCRKNARQAQAFIAWHDKELKLEEEYTPKRIREGLGMKNKAAVQSYEQMLNDHPVLRILLDGEKDRSVKKRGAYKKKRNWYYPHN